ncbi:uncharacterized protein FFMR_08654 [Fusarium fujikuroi]|nr:uncharacterized protein FFMR_08654 [Fusarium fujikuroi]
MNSDEAEGASLGTAKKLIPLIIKTIADSTDTKSLAMMNARSELDFELSMALLDLENCQVPPENEKRLPRNIHRLVEVLGNVPRKVRDHQLKPPGHFQQLMAALARSFGYQTDSRPLSLVQLPQTADELRAIAQTVSSLRKKGYAGAILEMAADQESDGPNEQEAAGVIVEQVSPLRSDDPISKDEISTAEVSEYVKKKRTAAKRFMQEAHTLYDEKIRPLTENKRLKDEKAIRVAVLDTGVDKREAIFRAVRGNYGTCLKDTASFILDRDPHDTHDTHGHGTRVAALIVQIAPHVNLFIAKVCNDKTIHGVNQYVEAIKWAMDQKVHIINISASMNDDDDIREIIVKAQSQGILVFAAASDNKAGTRRAFPGSIAEVLAIHSADGRGNIGLGNPEHDPHDANFSTLGEEIRSPLKDRKFLTGVSYSTAIASGIAANILTLADVCFNESPGDQALRRRAFRSEGMKKIFLKVSGKRNGDGYNYVRPVRLVENFDTTEGYRHWLMDALRS